jgi:hypothetical protein
MIKRNDDFGFIDDSFFTKLAEVVKEQEVKKTVEITKDAKRAQIVSKQLAVLGYHTEIHETNGTYKVIAFPKKRLDFYEAMQSGQFKKVAWGMYSFNRQANEQLGFTKYDFDDGSIWKVVKGSDGKDYLVKEVDDKDENKVVRTKTKQSTPKVASLENDVTKENVKDVIHLLYDNVNDDFIDDMLQFSANELLKMVEEKLKNTINASIQMNKFISSPKFTKDIKKEIVNGINKKQIHTVAQLKYQIKKLGNEIVAGKGDK